MKFKAGDYIIPNFISEKAYRNKLDIYYELIVEELSEDYVIKGYRGIQNNDSASAIYKVSRNKNMTCNNSNKLNKADLVLYTKRPLLSVF